MTIPHNTPYVPFLALCLRLQIAYQLRLIERRRRAKNSKRITLRTWRTAVSA
jgi:hypothetical protein